MFTMKKQMLIDGHQLPVILRRNVVSIDNNPVLWSFINQNPLRNTQKLIDYIQADYQKIFGKKFPLSDNSFIMEIWGHMYFESFLVNYKNGGRCSSPLDYTSALSKPAIKSTAVYQKLTAIDGYGIF